MAGTTPPVITLQLSSGAHRTNLDTRAFRTGRLVAGVFTDEAGPPVAVREVRGT